MSERDYQEVRDELSKCARELAEIRLLLKGGPYDREDAGLIGAVNSLQVAMYGPPEKRNGLVGKVTGIYTVVRLIGVGIVIGVGTAIMTGQFG